MIEIFIITRREFFALATVIILYINLDVLLQITGAQKKMSNELLKNRFMRMIFNIYIILLITIVYFPIPIVCGEYVLHKNPPIHIIPWQSTIRMYKKYGLGEVIENIGGNLILLSPMVFFLCYYFKKICFNIKGALFIALSMSLFIECSQVTLSIIIPNYSRTFDTMDLICNTIGGLIGYGLYHIYNKIIVDAIETKEIYR